MGRFVMIRGERRRRVKARRPIRRRAKRTRGRGAMDSRESYVGYSWFFGETSFSPGRVLRSRVLRAGKSLTAAHERFHLARRFCLTKFTLDTAPICLELGEDRRRHPAGSAARLEIGNGSLGLALATIK